jgi:hypothetical protein
MVAAARREQAKFQQYGVSVSGREIARIMLMTDTRSAAGLSCVVDEGCRQRCGRACANLGTVPSSRSPRVFLGFPRIVAVEVPRGADPAI